MYRLQKSLKSQKQSAYRKTIKYYELNKKCLTKCACNTLTININLVLLFV